MLPPVPGANNYIILNNIGYALGIPLFADQGDIFLEKIEVKNIEK